MGDWVEPGPDWNDIRLGTRFSGESSTVLRLGSVMEIKPWGSGSLEHDCVAVRWKRDKGRREENEPMAPLQIYRWGVMALNGKRMFDVRRTQTVVETCDDFKLPPQCPETFVPCSCSK